jgi:poly(A) polymerase
VLQDKPVTPTFLFAVLLWPAIKSAHDSQERGALQDSQAWFNACDQVVAQQQRRVAIPKRFTIPMTELIAMQPRFERRDGRRALRLLEHPRFRAAYDFLLLRAAAGEADPMLAEWWTNIQTQSPEQRIASVEHASADNKVGSEPSSSAKRRRRRRRRPAA